jgi:hypothetical protein
MTRRVNRSILSVSSRRGCDEGGIVGARRWALAGLAIGGFVLLTPMPAGAVVGGSLNCQGHATITAANGKTYEVDAKDNKATIPRDGEAQYTGSTSPISHNHSGSIKVDFGPFAPEVYTWSGKNAENKPSSTGVKKMPKVLKQVPPGEYLLKGSHSGQDGACSGHIILVIDGSPLSNPIGVGAVAGTAVFGLLTLLAGVAKAGRVVQ